MPIALATYFVALQLVGISAPSSGISGEEILAGSPSPPSVRTKIGIIWSCLVTIFSCTWVAAHPNIPGPNAKWWLIFLRRVRLMVVALLAPEAVIFWAMKQWIAAYKLGHKYRSYGWTQAHGYFVIMGGLAIFEGDEVHHVVTAEELGDLLKNGEIRITEKEIRDKGRGDALSKGLVLIQTTWFILQCIARKVAHLPITELELVTLAFAALNFVTYALWWYKPLNVECPVRVYRQRKPENGDGEVSSGIGGTRDAEADEREEASGTTWSMIATDIETTMKTAMAIVCEMSASIGKAMAEIGRNYVLEYRCHVVWHAPVAVLAAALVAALFPVLGLLFGLGYVIFISLRLIGGIRFESDGVIEAGAKEVPTFYAGPKELMGHAVGNPGFAACVIAMIFGSVHCVGWSFAFPSYAEQHLWRIASISVTSIPVLVIVTMNSLDGENRMAITILLISASAYLIGRLMLLVLPFMALRSLAAEAYQTVQWTTFIPHV